MKNVDAKEFLESMEKQQKKVDDETKGEKKQLFQATSKLFELKEGEANLYSDIQGTMAACRNLQSHINKLAQEFQRQQELLYNAEYQIQLMERRVAKARGEMTVEE